MGSCTKNPTLVLIAPLCTGLFLAFVVVPWTWRSPQIDGFLGLATRSCSTIWVLILWWSLHQVTFQIAAFFVRPRPPGGGPSPLPSSFDILYTTCDDFVSRSAASCVQQDYPAAAFRVIVCDDSSIEESQASVDRFRTAHPEVLLSRRASRRGFKAGNLNSALGTFAASAGDWAVVVDADQILPRDYLTRLSNCLATVADDVAFVQGRLKPGHDLGEGVAATRFQRTLEPEILIFGERDLYCRERFGFLPFLGHGGCVRRRAWEQLGGFPELVSEDYGFSMTASHHDLRGVRTDDACSSEAYPPDFPAFLVRLSKYAEGAAELLRRRLPGFLLGRAGLVEKVDLVALLAWYVVMPLTLINVFLSAWICHRISDLGLPMLHAGVVPILAGCVFLMLATIASVIASPVRTIRFWSWATAVYTAAMPTAALAFVRAMVLPARFRRTPKTADACADPRFVRKATHVLAGAATIAIALHWRSPFSPTLCGYGFAWLIYPALDWLDSGSVGGMVARVLIHGPLMLLLGGILAMWLHATL